MSLRTTMALAIGALAWVACIVGGFSVLQRYAATAGAARAPEEAARDLISSHRPSGRALLVMAIHPNCPCSEASLAELGDLLARSRGVCGALIIEYQPVTPQKDWPQVEPYQELGGVRVPVVADLGGKLAITLGAQTSGHVIFVNAKGEFGFQGGITLARGHRGRSPAQDAILDQLAGKAPTLTAAPVYGCALEAECKIETAL